MTGEPETWPEWQQDWEARKAGKDCVLCGFLATEDSQWGLRVLDGRYLKGYLWRRGRIPGYGVAIWKHGHVTEPTDLDESAAAGYWLEVLRLGRALQVVYQPAKMNYQTLGNGVPHLHTHLVPRPHRDPAPHRALPWTYLDEGRQSDEELLPAAQRLRSLL